MKIVKPLKVGVLHRTFEHRRVFKFVPSVFVHFSLEHPTIALQEQALWPMVVEELGRELVFDEGMPKLRGEVLLAARAYPPGGRAPVCSVRARLGPIDKSLVVVGDRSWERGVPTEPIPFSGMPILWSNAFGGVGFEANPVGKGFAPILREGKEVHPLPNVERPGKLITAPSQRPEPAGFGALDPAAPSRRARAGTYDSRWLNESFPGLADDVDWLTFNLAPEDQWAPEGFRGDEAILLENLHPSRPRIESRLPDLVARAFVARGDEFTEVPLRIDTVYLFPHRLRGVVIFRGVTDVSEDDAADVDVLMVGCERRGAPRTADHYRAALDRRLDRAKAHIHALREADLMPPRDPAPPPVEGERLQDAGAELKLEKRVVQNQRRRAEAQLAEVRADLVRRGVDPAEHGVPEALPAQETDLPLEDEELADHLENQLERGEAARSEAEARIDAQLREARAVCEAQGIDFDALVAEREAEQGGPPKFSAAEELEKLEARVQLGRNAGMPIEEAERALAEPGLGAKLQRAEDEHHDIYRRFAHRFPPARAREPERALRLRDELEAAVARGESLARRDFTSVDLTGVNLRGADLRGAYLEGARLADADLSGADLRDAVFVRADLTDARLVGAELAGANLGDANLVRTDLSGGVDLTGVSFGKARCEETRFRGARLARNEFLDAVFVRCDWREVTASELQLFGTAERPLDLSGSSFDGCRLDRVNFLHVRLDGASFVNADVRGCVLAAVSAEGVDFSGADASNLRVVDHSSMPGARFIGARLCKANLRATNLAGSDFSTADLTGADMSESNLEGANLERIHAPGLGLMKARLCNAKLARANLVEALLQKADIAGADMRGANLFRVNFARVKGSKQTRFDGANMKHILFVERGA